MGAIAMRAADTPWSPASVLLQIKTAQADMEHLQSGKLAQLAGAVAAKISGYRNMLSMLKTEVRSQLQHVHQDQANAIKRALYRIQTVRSDALCPG